MSRGTSARSFLDGISRLNRQQWLLRALILILPFVGFGVEMYAGAPVQTLPVALIVVFTLLSALVPDSHFPLTVVLALGGYWAISVQESLSWPLLVLTATLVAFHVTCLLASYGPPSVVLDGPLLRLWLWRSAVVTGVAGLVWVAARLADGIDPAAPGWLAAAGLVVLVGWAGLLSRKLAVGAG